jgi:hypothetical protein
MASAQSAEKFFANNKVTCYLSGDATTIKDIAWVDMQDYAGIAVQAQAAALTGLGVTVFKIIANSEADGSGTDAIVVAHAVGSAPDAANDALYLECTAEQIREVETSSTGQLRYVSAQIDAANASDQIAVTYIRHGARFAESGLTADSVA